MTRRRSLDHLDKAPTILGHGVRHVGVLDGRNNFLVHGRVEGDGNIDGVLMIGDAALWVGNIEADMVIVKGRVEGNIHARFKLEIRSSARIKGDLSSPLIAIADGAVLQGKTSLDSIITRFSERRTH